MFNAQCSTTWSIPLDNNKDTTMQRDSIEKAFSHQFLYWQKSIFYKSIEILNYVRTRTHQNIGFSFWI